MNLPSSGGPSAPDSQLRRIAVAALAARVVGIDGRSGAGKSTLAAELAAEIGRIAPERRVTIVEVEDFIAGWDGLVTGVRYVASNVAAPLAREGLAVTRNWDWVADAWGSERRIPDDGVADIVLLTGCGSTSKPCVPFLDLTIWCEADRDARRARAAARDPYDWSEQWETWADQEAVLLAEHRSDLLADIVVES